MIFNVSKFILIRLDPDPQFCVEQKLGGGGGVHSVQSPRSQLRKTSKVTQASMFGLTKKLLSLKDLNRMKF